MTKILDARILGNVQAKHNAKEVDKVTESEAVLWMEALETLNS